MAINVHLAYARRVRAGWRLTSDPPGLRVRYRLVVLSGISAAHQARPEHIVVIACSAFRRFTTGSCRIQTRAFTFD